MFMRNYFSAFLLVILIVLGMSCGNNKKSSQSVSSNPVTANWKLGVQTYTFRFFSLEDALIKVDSADINYVEFYHGQPITTGSKDVFGTSFSAEGKAALKKAMDRESEMHKLKGLLVNAQRQGWLLKLSRCFVFTNDSTKIIYVFI